MNHAFAISWTDVNKCKLCGYDKNSHTELASCESCGNITTCEFYPHISELSKLRDSAKMLLCKKCIDLELTSAKKVTEEDIKSMGEMRVELHNIRMMQDVIECRQQYFNAEIQSINDLKSEVMNDVNIEDSKKNDVIAERMVSRLNEMKKVLWETQEKESEISNKIRANITFMNDFAQHLRLEVRERLKLTNINYNPVLAKPVKDMKLTAPRISKEDRAIKDLASLLKISEQEARRRITGKAI
jgi:hypothetical protein